MIADTRLDRVTARPIIAVRTDDSLAETYTELLPFLREYGVPATNGVIPHRIGITGSCSAAQLVEMEAAGWEFALHGDGDYELWDGESDPVSAWKLAYYNDGTGNCNLAAALAMMWETWKEAMADYGWDDSKRPDVAIIPLHNADIEIIPSIRKAGYKYLTSAQTVSGSNYQGLDGNTEGWYNWGIFHKAQQSWWNRYRLNLLYGGSSYYLGQVTWAVATQSPVILVIHPQNMTSANYTDLQAAIEYGIQNDAVFTTLSRLFEYVLDPRNAHCSGTSRDVFPFGKFGVDKLWAVSSIYNNGTPHAWSNRPAKWAIGLQYSNQKVYHEGAQYTCQSLHTSTADNAPGTAGGLEYWGESTGVPTYVRANADGGPATGSDYMTVNFTLNNQCQASVQRTVRAGRWYRLEWWGKDGTTLCRPRIYTQINSGSVGVASTVYYPGTWPPNAHTDWFFHRDYIWVPRNAVDATLIIALSPSPQAAPVIAHYADVAVYETEVTDPAYDWDTSDIPPLA